MKVFKPLFGVSSSSITIPKKPNFITRTFSQVANPVNSANSAEFEVNAKPANNEIVPSDHNSLEIKDSSIIFNTIWSKLEQKYGRENLRFPKEIIWLMGSPGAGKSFNAPWIRRARGITADELVISSLLTSEEAQKDKKTGGLVNDSYVLELLLQKLLLPIYDNGVVVDGFPRTKLQVDFIKMLKDKMLLLRDEFFNTNIGPYFRRPVFRVAVLFVDENESIERQMKRGREAQIHNEKVQDTGIGAIVEERFTDFNEEKARQRYRVFKEHYPTLKELQKFFPFSIINTKAPVQKVRDDIMREFMYQSSLELASETYDAISKIPLQHELTEHARQNLVRRLDNYQTRHTELFNSVIEMIKEEFVPRMRQQSISGEAQIRTQNRLFGTPLVLEMVLDILSERGYDVAYHPVVNEVPIQVNLQTGDVTCKTTTVLVFNIKFQKKSIIRTLDEAFAF